MKRSEKQSTKADEKTQKDEDELGKDKKEPLKVELSYEENSFFDLRTTRSQFLFIFITSLAAILVSQIPVRELRNYIQSPVSTVKDCSTTSKPTYWIYGSGGEGQWLHVRNVLNRLGFVRVTENESDTADLLWAHDYPFTKLRPKILALKPHQKVNHLPGCGFLTNKIDLATTKMKFIPPAFKLPINTEEFKEYAKSNPKKRFVVKHHQHRHIKIKKIDEINLNDNLTFVQEFIENPLLVDGYKFDIGVYTIITSVDPLRVYYYSGDILFRYCAQKYHPFDPANVDKYIVGDDYLPTWEIKSLSRYYNGLGFGMKASFDAYMKNNGKDPQVIWDQVEDAIRSAILLKEPHIRDILKNYKTRNFFEMARFDLIVDADLKVFLMEANMSPNLSSAHFKQNFILYEQVIYNVLNLVGVGNYLFRENFLKRDRETELMLSTDKNIMVNADICGRPPCSESCAPVDCQLCKPCLSHSDIANLHNAYREHVNRGDTKRIFPVIEDVAENLSSKNEMMTKWFQAKCVDDSNWC